MNRMFPLLATVALAAASAGAQNAAPAAAPALPVEAIVANANRVSYYQGRDGRAQVRMVIVDAQGRERSREMTILRLDVPPAAAPSGEARAGDGTAGAAGTGKAPAAGDAAANPAPADDTHCGEQKFYVRFRQPADVDKTTFLVWKKPGQDDDRWLYLPALDLVKRVSSADKRSSFVGSHFFYEDVSGRHVAADTHELVETTKNYYVVESKPVDAKSVEFAAYKMWIHRESFTVVKVEFRDAAGEVYRRYEVLGVETVQGYPTVTKARMSDLRSNGSTTVTYSEVAYDLGLPDEVFTERYLRREPRQWLR
jgi:outer membrane lipoprotein-sorting protein